MLHEIGLGADGKPDGRGSERIAEWQEFFRLEAIDQEERMKKARSK